MSSAPVPSPVRDATATATAVYLLLADRDEALPTDTIADELGASPRAVKTAVADLRAADVLVSRPDPEYPNRHLHAVSVSP
jgi:Mn-dependent DtxR family transcriptional regulator